MSVIEERDHDLSGVRRVRSTANIYNAALLCVVIGSLVALPMVAGPYSTRVGGTILMFVALAQSWNLIGGYLGLMSLAHSAFFGLGAVGATIFLINGVPFLFAGLGGVILAVAVALLVGAPTLRLQGHYFVIATLLISEALLNGIRNLNVFGFHGAISHNITSQIGLTNLDAAQYNQIFFYAMATLAGFTMLIVWLLQRSKWGLALKAIRDADTAAAAIGISVARIKLTIFVISAAIAAMVGVASAAWLGIVDATAAFDVTITFQVIVMVFLGGRGTLLGPVIGVVLVFSLNEIIGIEFAEISTIVAGVIVVAIVLLLPDGLVEIFRKGPRVLSLSTIRKNLYRYKVK
ncbi:branched-chain amino acid ABC transporter permease [Limibacillus halophilus]|uniref:Branched-chain amino acid transport system permease protein n=1 Tax=Limibacillus halophilus TaxID=1579333 RepID=A0A839SW25_9PROT|nr:branched-chain amino acid ABC transporter permease [Limibacillus halophilus]MBB3066997.1 branched-chain amino acid transport system permease protein [Limibacillus halophilus]